MAYSFQTFSVGQVLTAAQVNQIEVNVRDHVHGVSGVSATGTFGVISATQLTVNGVMTTLGEQSSVKLILNGTATNRNWQADVGVLTAGYLNFTPSTANGGSTFTTPVVQFSDGTVTTAGILVNGKIGVGAIISPTAAVHLPAGTTVANTAPMKFTSGSLLTAAEVGAVEFLTDAWYGTITTGAARKTFAFTDSNITGNAATVTTNANLTGHVTSSGNAAVLGSFTIAQLNTAVSDANVLTDGGALGTPSSGVITNLTGAAAGITGVGTLASGTVPLARMGTVALNSSVIASANTGYSYTVSTTDQAHEFYQLSFYNETSSVNAAYGTSVSPLEVIYSVVHCIIAHVKGTGRLLYIQNGDSGSQTINYKVYKLTET